MRYIAVWVLVGVLIVCVIWGCILIYVESNTTTTLFGDVSPNTMLWSYGFPSVARQFGFDTYEYWKKRKHFSQGSQTIVVVKTEYTFPYNYPKQDVNMMYNKYEKLYVQNLDRSALTPTQSEKTIAIPLGVDFHTVAQKPFWRVPKSTWQNQEKHLLTLRSRALPPSKRICKVLVTWNEKSTTSNRHVKDGYKSRPQLWKEAMSNPEVFELGTGNRNETWKLMSQYAFMYSPIGDGFGCHRTWEALALGCIVIAQPNPTIKEFVDRYPIILHNDPANITVQDLEHWAHTHTSTKLEDMTIGSVLN